MVTICGKFYLKSGIIIEDSSSFAEDKVANTVKHMRAAFETAFDANNIDFCFTFGSTIIRGSDLSAVVFNILKD